MRKEMKIYYQHRRGVRGDLPTAPKLVIANHSLKNESGFSIGDKVTVEYLKGTIIITKLNSNL
ncbi:MAG: hypothetical protein V1649_01935 [Patescibacteria group bacterium]